MRKRRLRNRLAGLALAVVAGLAQATLFDRGRGLIYDDELNITWMQDAGHFAGTWDEANSWVDSLVYAGYDDWRLPKAFSADYGCALAYGDPACYSEGIRPLPGWSEIAHMFFELGNISGDPFTWEVGPDGEIHQRTGYGFLHRGPFTNVADLYWLAPADPQFPGRAFYFPDGMEGAFELLDQSLAAWAVRDGDVSPVPEQANGALLLAGLVLIIGRLRTRPGRLG